MKSHRTLLVVTSLVLVSEFVWRVLLRAEIRVRAFFEDLEFSFAVEAGGEAGDAVALGFAAQDALDA